MNEKDFAVEIKHSLETQLRNCHYKKIPDQIFNPSSFARFNPDKDYDAFAVYQGCFSALEYKFHKKTSAFPLSSVSMIQRSSLLDVAENGGNAYVVVGVRIGNLRRCYFIAIRCFLAYEGEAGRKSMPLSALESYASAKWLGKGIWELDEKWFRY